MTWFKVDDKLHSHEKVMYLGDEDSDAMALWVIAGSWSADQLTDGWVPYPVARRLDAHFERRAKALVRVGLWDEAVRNGVPGWLFHGWNEPGRQPTREQVEQERTTKSARQQRWREKNRTGAGQFGVDGDVDASTGRLVDGDVDASRDGDVDTARVDTAPSRPDPTRPVLPPEVRKSSSPTSGAATGDGLFPEPDRPAPAPRTPPLARFDEFWRAYPKRVGKLAAQKAYEKAIASGVSPGILIGNASVYAMEKSMTEREFIKNPATWLNQGCWMDDPDPTYRPPAAPLTAQDAVTVPLAPGAAERAPGAVLAAYVAPAHRASGRVADDFGGDAHMARYIARAEARQAAGETFL